MKIEELQKYIQNLSPELYSFAYVLIPDDLQASQLMIDCVQSFLIQKKGLVDKMVLSKKIDSRPIYKTYITPDDYLPSIIYLVISNVDIEHIDLLDIIHNYSGNRIVNGFIKQINCANYEKYMNSNSYCCKDKPIFNITIQNCPNLKIINNIIDFENNAHLKICNCSKLEFIQNYNNFSEIYIDNHRVKVVIE